MKLTVAGKTDRGRRRDQNEDAYLVDESAGLYAVCDGMGGHAAGEVASSKSLEYLTSFLEEHRATMASAHESPGGHYQIVELVESAIQNTCKRIHELACSDPDYRGMGTTMTVLVVVGSKAIMGHVGDSRLYVVREWCSPVEQRPYSGCGVGCFGSYDRRGRAAGELPSCIDSSRRESAVRPSRNLDV